MNFVNFNVAAAIQQYLGRVAQLTDSDLRNITRSGFLLYLGAEEATRTECVMIFTSSSPIGFSDSDEKNGDRCAELMYDPYHFRKLNLTKTKPYLRKQDGLERAYTRMRMKEMAEEGGWILNEFSDFAKTGCEAPG